MKISKQSLERPHTAIPEELPSGVEIKSPMTGVKTWTNPRNKFRIVRLHRSADPSKRSDQWIEASRAGMPYTDWLREYEIHWKSFQGKPVFLEDWDSNFHVAKEPLDYEPAIPIIRGWDFGLSPACLFAQLRAGGRLLILREIIGEEIGIERFQSEVNRLTKEWFPRATRFMDIVDPAGMARKDTDERSCTEIMRGSPLYAKPMPGLQNPAKRRGAVVQFLQRVDRGTPCFQVDERVTTLIGGFDGGYHYAYTNNGLLREHPEKNRFSHVHDACQYICTKVDSLDMKRGGDNVVIREPKFNFGSPTVQELKIV